MVPPDEEGDDRPLSYTLAVDAALFGRLRLRCWNGTDMRPSSYSEEVKLPRFQGRMEEAKTPLRLKVEKKRAELLGLVEGGGGGASPSVKRSGTCSNMAAALSKSGTCSNMAVAPSKSASNGAANEGKGRRADAPSMPYDVPPPPDTLPGLAEGRAALASFYEEVGVEGGGEGCYCGLRIDHVLHAVGAGQVRCTLHEPLMVLLEVLYADVLLPMLATVACLKHEWAFMIEKVQGQVAQACALAPHYASCDEQLHEILEIAFELRETMRQCEPDCVR